MIVKTQQNQCTHSCWYVLGRSGTCYWTSS